MEIIGTLCLNNTSYVSANKISVPRWDTTFLRGLKPWFRGRDREIRGVELDRTMKGCMARALSDDYKEKIGLLLTAWQRSR